MARLIQLSEKEEKFCQGIAIGLTQTQAAERAGYGGNHAKVGYETMQRQHVKDRIAVLKAKIDQQIVKKTTCDLQGHIDELATIRDMAKADGKLSVALDAEVKRGEVVGLYLLSKGEATKNQVVSSSNEVKTALIQAMNKLGEHGIKLEQLERVSEAKVINPD